MFPSPQLANPSLVFYSVRYGSFILQGSSPWWGGEELGGFFWLRGTEGLCSFSLGAQEGRRQGAVCSDANYTVFIIKIDLFYIYREWQKCSPSIHGARALDLQRGWGCHWWEMLQVGLPHLLQVPGNLPAARSSLGYLALL